MSKLRNEPKLTLLILRNLKPKHLNRINKPNCHSSIYQKKDSEGEKGQTPQSKDFLLL